MSLMNVQQKSPNQRMIGLVLGAGMGFIYSIVSISINPLFIRDLPLYANLKVSLSQVFWSTLAGGLVGFIVNLTESGFSGVVIASLLGSLAIFVGTLVKASQSYGAYGLVLVVFIYTILPLTVFFMPLSLLFRWAAGYFNRNPERKWWQWQTLRVYLLLIALAVMIGSFPLYSTEAQKALHNMNKYIQWTQYPSGEKVPYAFATVEGVVRNADRQYNLEWTDDLSRFPTPLASESGAASVSLQMVIAHFGNGQIVACLFNEDASLYLCSSE
jgi:hypothetical protein